MTETKENSFFRQRLELLLLADDAQISERIGPVISRHFITFKHVPNLKEFSEQKSVLGRPQLIVLKHASSEGIDAVNDRVSDVVRLYPKSSVIVIRKNPSDDPEAGEELHPKAYGLSVDELYSTAKLEYLLLSKIRSHYFSFPVTDLFPSTTVSFSAFMRATLNQRYLPVVIAGRTLSDARFQRLQEVERIYFPVVQAPAYYDYVQNYYDTSGVGLRKRVRALFLQFLAAGIEVFDYALLDVRNANTEKIEQIYTSLVRKASALIGAMEKSEDPWEIIREAEENEFLNFWRAPVIGAFAAVMSLKSKQGDPVTALLVGFFAELGMWQLSYDFFQRYQEKGMSGVLPTEKPIFEASPMNALNRMMSKGFPMDDAVKAALVCVMERADGKGFPNQTPIESIPVEALIVRFAIGLEREMRTTLKATGTSFRFMREKYWEEVKKDAGDFGDDFLTKISDSLV